MALLELHPDLKQLKRLADLLEWYLVNVHGMSQVLDEEQDDLDVSYTTDTSALKNELRDVHAGKNPDRTIDVDDGA